MSTHTPGPWKFFYKQKYDEWHVSVPLPDSSMRLALFDDGLLSENPEADARLIAAAPDLLGALIAAHAQLADVELMLPGDFMTPVLENARAAIAKATGAPSTDVRYCRAKDAQS